MSTIYVETTIVSYLTARLSQNVVSLSRQLLTRQWWEQHSQQHELLTSQFVVEEASLGDPDVVQRRLDVMYCPSWSCWKSQKRYLSWQRTCWKSLSYPRKQSLTHCIFPLQQSTR